jgi:hypothetical protein
MKIFIKKTLSLQLQTVVLPELNIDPQLPLAEKILFLYDHAVFDLRKNAENSCYFNDEIRFAIRDKYIGVLSNNIPNEIWKIRDDGEKSVKIIKDKISTKKAIVDFYKEITSDIEKKHQKSIYWDNELRWLLFKSKFTDELLPDYDKQKIKYRESIYKDQESLLKTLLDKITSQEQ